MTPDEQRNLITLLAGGIALYASITYMLQSRHNALDSHERSLQDQYIEIELNNSSRWIDLKSRGILNEDEAYKYCLNILHQLSSVRTRYNLALVAFILVMVQLFFFIIAVCWFSFQLFDALIPNQKLALFVEVILFAPGILCLIAHVIFDAAWAFRTQNKCREWLNYKTDEVNNQRIPRIRA